MLRCGLRALSLGLITFFVACGSSSSPTDPGGGGETGPVTNPDGVLLDGDAGTAARDALNELAPSPDSGAVSPEGALTARLQAMLAPSATVAEVNGALDATDARIVSMEPNSPFVTLKVPAVVDLDAARGLAAQLQATSAFTWVAAAMPARSVAGGLASMERVADVRHLQSTRALATWNVADLGLATQRRVPVLMPEEYTASTRHDEIDAQRMVGFGAPNPLPGPDIYPGNTGYVLAGIVGANVDETAPTGINPYPNELLEIRSMPVGGLTWQDIIWMMAWQLAAAGDEFVVHSALQINDPEMVVVSALDRAMAALAWRVATAPHRSKFITVLPTPYEAQNALAASPFQLAASYADLREFLDDVDAPEEDVATFAEAWDDVHASLPSALQPMTNTLNVGADFSGGLSSYLVAPGASVVGPCDLVDPAAQPGYLCDGDVAVYSGHSMASAQVAGLAAYMMSLTDATAAEVQEAIIRSSNRDGLIDAHVAVLSLDSPNDLRVHEALLDVASFESPNEDGRFDEWDIEAIIDPDGPNRRAPDDVRDASLRYDFNGDGSLSPNATARVDLNLDGTFGVVSVDLGGQSVNFDENAVRDIDVVCVFAYSAAYSGSLVRRDELLLATHAGLQVEIFGLPDRIAASSSFEVQVRVGVRAEDGSITFVPGATVELDVDDAEVTPGQGETNAAGFFTAMVTIDDDTGNEVEFEASARLGDEFAVARAFVLRENEIRLLERESILLAGVFSSYNQDVGIPAVRIVNLFEQEETTGFAFFDESLNVDGSGSGAGMSVSGRAEGSTTSRLELVGDDELRAFYVTSEQSTNLTLSNPNFEILRYQADAYVAAEHVIAFVVYGDPATVSLHGSTGDVGYSIELEGDDSEVFVCRSDDAPCNTISFQATLPAGYYELEVYHDGSREFRWADGCTDCTATSGTRSSQGELDLDFEIEHRD